MKINEIFYSIQGEGKFIGVPMVFIRVTGCNLRCSWCDTKYAYEDGYDLSLEEIVERIKKYQTRCVCLTGGEPLHQQETPELLDKLVRLGYTIYLETNGSYFLGELPKSESIRISLDIKCPSSGEEQKMNFANIELLSSDDQVKFIIADNKDYNHAKKIIKKYLLTFQGELIFTPVSEFKNEKNADIKKMLLNLRKLTERVLRDGLRVRVLPQLHKLIWTEKSCGI